MGKKQIKTFTDQDVDRIMELSATVNEAGLALVHSRKPGDFRWTVYDNGEFLSGHDNLLHMEIYMSGYRAAQDGKENS